MHPNLAQVAPSDSILGKRAIDLDHDWQEYGTSLPQCLDARSFLQRTRREEGDVADKLPTVDVDTLNEEQRTCFDFVLHHHDRRRQGVDIPPLRLIVQGAAGTGKSYVIGAIEQTLNLVDDLSDVFPTCMLLAPTGVAAAGIGGRTIHSALQLPLKLQNLKDLKGKAAESFQNRWSRVSYIVVDERSMVGCNLFAAMDVRLRQAKPHASGQSFGGISVILIGDPFQLPPVCDPVLFAPSSNTSTVLVQTGRLLYREFTQALVLSIPQRQTGIDDESVWFRQFLHRVKYGQVQADDHNRLMTRQLDRLSAEVRLTFGSALRVLSTNDTVDSYNQKFLMHMGGPVARIEAIHKGTGAANVGYDDAGGLDKVIYVAAGCRVMLNWNAWTTKGLVNGAVGTVQGIVYEGDSRPPALPVAVIVQFDDYRGPSCLPDVERCVPICPLKRTWTSPSDESCSRTQIPLSLAHAVTVFKAQGSTLSKASVDIGRREYAAGLGFVAFSRVKKFSDLALENFVEANRILNLGKSQSNQLRIAEEVRLKGLGLQY
ncbi:putative ATP-dependent DNA helicase PIF1 [Hypsibius exemplaris]|uniref:ATP-dependent DNA helicase n=1 Tax=Hypsibius exemplaris TaxID=2072580 RepID=A0A9X6RKF1_HYPEX|nr:putative ATP-dependent DNA helicase PIF1 [Hypsibius exemplaris]